MRRNRSTRMAALLLAVAAAIGGTSADTVLAEGISMNQQTQTSSVPVITILPIDRAAVLAGQKLDFRVEVTSHPTGA